jgi:hypothetical protein
MAHTVLTSMLDVVHHQNCPYAAHSTALQANMRVYDDARHHAASAWIATNGDIPSAVDMFTKTLHDLGMKLPLAPASFVRYWGEPWPKVKSVAGRASRSGRPRLVTDKQAKRCVDVVLQWREDGLSGPYKSIRHLINTSTYVKGLVEANSASPRTLARAMQRVCPTLSYKKLVVKAKLTAKHKEDRVAVCKQHLEASDDTLETVVWVDAKTMLMNITHRYGWVDCLKEDVFETTRASTRKSNIIKLKYYIAVNARLGPVMLAFYTGTTGMPAERDGVTYLVSSTNVQLRAMVVLLFMHCLLDGLSPAPAAALLRSRYQPHHTEASLLSSGCQGMVFFGPACQTAVFAVGSGV